MNEASIIFEEEEERWIKNKDVGFMQVKIKLVVQRKSRSHKVWSKNTELTQTPLLLLPGD